MSAGSLIDLEFDVGEREKHHVRFHFNQFWGNLTITVDGNLKIARLRTLDFNLTKRCSFPVGTNEVHEVLIETRRKLFFSGFRQQVATAFVDGDAVAQDASFAHEPVDASPASP